jgi:excisionase family DNA binding protein
MENNPEKLLLRLGEAAVILSLSRAKTYQMAKDGQIPGVIRMGKSVRVSAAALQAWVKELAEAA